MRGRQLVATALGALAWAIAGGAIHAQEVQQDGASANDAPLGGGEIVVTARRKEESLQDVPEFVNVVTAEAVEKLKLTQFTELQTVVPGLTLAQDGSGTQTSTSLRGVTFDARSTAPPTVAMYLNDAPVQSLFLFDSLFDIGQIEVLRGPQGTTRGVSAPSGAITVTTRAPDASEWGGYAQGQLTNRRGYNLQGAVNVPVIRDIFAIRAAGVGDWTESNSVRSINNSERPEVRTLAGRLSVLFNPAPDLSAQVSYTHIDKRQHAFEQVSGPGQGTALSPPVRASDRRSVQDEISDVRVNLDVVTARLEAPVLGHQLTYVGSYQQARTFLLQDNDIGNVLPGIPLDYVTVSSKDETTHEVRLSSEQGPGRVIDYTVGFFYDWAETYAGLHNPGILLPGAFGSPAGAPSLASFDPRYQIPIVIDVPYLSEEASVFANATLHLGPRTEVTGGVRHIWSKFQSRLETTLGAGTTALPPAFINPLLPNCAAAQLGSTYPGFCDVPVPGQSLPTASFLAKKQPTIYSLSIRHRVSDDLMVYASTGTSYRPPIASPGLQGAINAHPDPVLNSLTFHPAENSTNYEAGFKLTFLGGRGRFNATVFRQTFENLTTFIPNILYVSTASSQPTLANLTASVDAKVTGFEIDAAAQVGRFDLGVQVSYADGKVKGSQVPCNIVENGAPVFNTHGLISLCPGGSVSREPLWSATLRAEYAQPIGNGANGFIRTLVSYNPRSRNRVQPNFTVDAYAPVNLYVGVRSESGAWEVSAFARNLFSVDRTIDRSPVAYDANASLGTAFPQLIPAGGSGYYATLVNPRREFGLSLRYAFGSR
jgi:iron complex outermembrane receptor protein